MKLIETAIPDVKLIEPTVHGDARGFFKEVYQEQAFRDLGIASRFIQDNHSRSRRNALRGLHYQLPRAQAKLCRVVRGQVMDVVVDIRRGSPTFGRWVAAELSAENHRQLFVPRGFAHGFVVLSEEADFLYKCDDTYVPDAERGILWNDPDLGIDWGVSDPVLSDRDRALPRLSEVPEAHLPVFSARAS